MRNYYVVLCFGLLFLIFVPSGVYSLDVFGVEVGNTKSSQGTFGQVQNPGFEEGQDGWSKGQTSGTICSFTIDPDAFEGSNAAKLDVTNDGYCMLRNSTSIPIVLTGSHTLKVHAKVSGDIDHLTLAVYKSTDPNTPPNTPVGNFQPGVFSGDYELHQLTVDLNSGEYIRLELGIDNNNSGPSYVLFDNVELSYPGSYVSEQWELILDGGQGSGNCILVEKQDKTVTAYGDWVYTYQGEDVSGSYSDAPATVTDSSISFTASGTATNPSAPPGYQTSPFTLNLSGTAYNGHGSGTFELTFSTFGWPSSLSGSWEGTRTSGRGITAGSKATPCIPLLLLNN
jgi:hypothetical protein